MDNDVEVLVRRLVALVRSRAVATAADQASGVLLDLEVDHIRCRLEIAQKPEVPTGSLSPREAEVARMVAQGYPNKTIAAVLEISSFTVSSYLRRIFAKLGVNSRAAMVALVIENRLLPEARPHPKVRSHLPERAGPPRRQVLIGA